MAAHSRQADPEVVIAGAGPAGAIAALHLARAGHRVAMVDRRPFPREKVCGDGLIPDALKALGRAGLLEMVRAHAHAAGAVRIYGPERQDVPLPGEFLTLRREVLDALIVEAARTAGARLVEGRVAEVRPRADGGADFTLEGADAPLGARIALVATGADVSLLEPLGMVERRQPSALALRCYVRSTHVIDELLVSFDREILPGYGWIFPLGGGWYNVGCGVQRLGDGPPMNLRRDFERFTREFPEARALMDRATEQTPLRGAPLRWGLTGARPLGPPGILAVGEMLGTTYALTGEGIGKAMECGEIAAEVTAAALAAGDLAPLARYPGLLTQRIAPRYVGYEIASRYMSRLWACNLIVSRARRSRFLQRAAAGILAETVDPRTVFSLYGLLRSFVS